MGIHGEHSYHCTRQTQFTCQYSLIKAYHLWATSKGLVLPGVDDFTNQVTEETPDHISMWILEVCVLFFSTSMHHQGHYLPWYSCDEIDLDGVARLPNERRSTYDHGMKMRAALTYAYGRDPAVGTSSWHLTEAGVWRGNPSKSDRVTQYMRSMHRRKVRPPLPSHWICVNEMITTRSGQATPHKAHELSPPRS